MKLGAPEFGAYMIRVIMSSWLFALLISLTILLSFLSFNLKSLLSDIMIVLPACFLVPFEWSTFIHPFILRWCLSLKIRRVSSRQQIDDFASWSL